MDADLKADDEVVEVDEEEEDPFEATVNQRSPPATRVT